LSVPLINSLSQAQTYLPWVSFIAGLGGSLHCVGMCGGLAASSCEKSTDIFRYQIGRLIGYLCLGTAAGFIGQFLSFKDMFPIFPIISSLLLGSLFIYWGVQSYRGKRAELPTPKFLGRFYTHLWKKFVSQNKNFTKAFFIGLISIFLPCGLLYGVVLGTVALETPGHVVIALFFFWLGTVPAMVVAPGIVRQVLKPLKARLPKAYAISLVLIGTLTIGMRVMNLQEHKHASSQQHHCH
jgi:sulfite exporter TauE/SafE